MRVSAGALECSPVALTWISAGLVPAKLSAEVADLLRWRGTELGEVRPKNQRHSSRRERARADLPQGHVARQLGGDGPRGGEVGRTAVLNDRLGVAEVRGAARGHRARHRTDV